MNDQPQRGPRTWWQPLRKIMRRVRWCTMLMALLIIGIIVFFATHDLPGSLKQKLVAGLRARGLDTQIGHLRWRLYRGIVAEDVRFGPAEMAPDSPQLFIKEVEVKLPARSLLWFKFKQIDSLILSGGKFTWLVSDPDQPRETLSLTNLQARLLLLPGDQWELNHFTAGFAGVTLQLTGSVTNASAFRDWKIFQAQAATQPEVSRERLRRLVRTADMIRFAKPPEINVLIHGDARDPQSFSSEILLEALETSTPWGTLGHGQLNARLMPPATNHGPSRLEFHLRADAADTRWGGARQVRVDLHAAGEENTTNLIHARLEILAMGVDTPWLQATNARFSADWKHSLTNPVPAAGTVELLLTRTRSPWATADEVRFNGTLSTPPTNALSRGDESWGWWTNFASCALDWNCRFAEIRAEDFESKELSCSGSWHAPELTLTNLHSEMYRGMLHGSAGLDVATRKASFECSSDFDVQKAYPFLTTDARKWCQDQAFTWDKPPVAHASGSAILPPWTDRTPNWRAEVLPTLFVRGDFAVDHAGFRQVPINSARSHFSYSNMVWELPDLMIVRPEGIARVVLSSDFQTKDFYCHIDSHVDVKALRSLLDTNAQKALNFVTFTQPPLINMELWGRWHDYDRTGFKGRVAVTNFTFRGESASLFRGSLEYTNKFLLLTDGRVERPEGYAVASGVGVDFTAKRAFLTNGFGTLDPMALVRTLGPKITSYMEPYRFAKPPVISAYGVIPISEDVTVANLHFKIEGGPFQWMMFHSDHVGGTIDWVGQDMHVDLPQAAFYGGALAGTADFDFRIKNGSTFKFDMATSGADLHRLMADFGNETNKLEGTLTGHLVVTEANSESFLESWYGHGSVQLTNGLIWEIPIFGIFSPVLDSFKAGLGKSRARDANANFTITKSVIRSDDLEVRSAVLRILFRGTVGFDMKVDAIEEAQVGPPVMNIFLSPFTKSFEYKVTGTLKNPKSELKYSVVRTMVKPISFTWDLLKDLWPGESAPASNIFSSPPPASTNAPPVPPK